MSLTGKQIRELNSAYNSVYAKQEPVVENLAITEEQFEELCISILAEAFESYGMEVYGQTDLQEVIDPKTSVKNVAKEIIKQGIKGTIKTLKYPAIFGLGADTATGGKGSRTVLGLINNAIPIARDMYQAVKGNKEFAGTVLKDKEKGTFSTAEQDRKNERKNKKESVQYALHIVEDDSIKDLIDKKNKKDQKDINKDTNVINKDDKNSSDFPVSGQRTTDGKSAMGKTIDQINKETEEAEAKDKNKSNDNIKKDEIKKDEIKKDEIKKDEIKKDEIKKNEVKKDRLPDFGPPKEVTIKDFQPVDTKPKNPSGKVIPKPTKPLSDKSPAAKAGIPIEKRQKVANMNAAFQATKKKDSGYTKMDFIKDFPNSQTAKKFRKGERIPGFSYKKNLKNSYEPYHIVLGYLLSEGHADTINEAHYVMTQMDDQTVQEIVALDEGPVAAAGAVAGALTLGGMGLNAIRKQLDNKKKMEKGGQFKQGSMMDNIQKQKNMLKNLENY